MTLKMSIPIQIAGTLATFALFLQAETKTLSGYLVDKACSAELTAKGLTALAGHDRECALMDSCLESGFGVVTKDGKFIAFDAGGNKKAVESIKASKKDKNYQVTVTGDQQGDTIRVATLKIE
jgi:hypothetical protein